MSDLTHKFLAQLKADIAVLAAETGLASSKLAALAQKLDVTDAENEHPLSLDDEKNLLLLHVTHPAVAHLLKNPQRRRSDLLFFASSMMSIVNRLENDITDEHERQFHARLVRFALEECQGSWAGAV